MMKDGIPSSITLSMGEELRRYMQGLVKGNVEQFYPKVCISYATGRREDVDAPGCGPGMFYASSIAHTLTTENGIDVFTGLHVPAGEDWHVFLDKLSGRFSECQLLIVIVTPALFQSKPCLEEIDGALDAGLKILPLLFENPIPAPNDQWCMITKDDGEGKLMLSRVQRGFGKLNTMPSPPGTMLDQHDVAKQRVLEQVKNLLHVSSSAPEPSAAERKAMHAAAQAEQRAIDAEARANLEIKKAKQEAERAKKAADAEREKAKQEAERAKKAIDAKTKKKAEVAPAPSPAPQAQSMSRQDPMGFKAGELSGKWKVEGCGNCSPILGEETWSATTDDSIKANGCVCAWFTCPVCINQVYKRYAHNQWRHPMGKITMHSARFGRGKGLCLDVKFSKK